MKFKCLECGWCGPESEVLRAENPFADDGGITMLGCPECREPNMMTTACDEPGCERESTCGTAIAGGYRRTCGEHRPRV